MELLLKIKDGPVNIGRLLRYIGALGNFLGGESGGRQPTTNPESCLISLIAISQGPRPVRLGTVDRHGGPHPAQRLRLRQLPAGQPPHLQDDDLLRRRRVEDHHHHLHLRDLVLVGRRGGLGLGPARRRRGLPAAADAELVVGSRMQ